MEREKLEKYLDELKKEISNLGDYEEESASRLRILTENIEMALQGPVETDKDVIDNIQGNIEHFEEIHPSVTALLNRIATLLSDMGI